MGKKKIVKQDDAALLKEKEQIDAKLKKEVKTSSKRIKEGSVYISSTYNNTILSLADLNGNVLFWASAGNIGFKGAKKSTPFAASKVAETLAAAAQKKGIESIKVYIKGIGAGRDSAVRSLAARGLEILSIKDTTPVPHNGCRLPKPRRI